MGRGRGSVRSDILIRFTRLAETVSTNDDVKALAAAGEGEGLWLFADRQTGGRGRQGREWIPAPGNLFASTLILPHAGDPPTASLAFVAALALYDTVTAITGPDDIELKWPNDLLAGGAKLSGILLEAEGRAVIIGYGVNLAHAPDVNDRRVTSIADLVGSAPAPDDFLRSLADQVELWVGRWRQEGLISILRHWSRRAHPIGTLLRVTGPDGLAIDGTYNGLSDDGALRLRLADGREHVMHAGDVFLI